MENWLLVSFIAPFSWALVNLIDLWLSKEIFDEELGATAIIGLFGILPCLAIPYFGFPVIEIEYACLSILGGLLFAAFTYFYFRSLYRTDDVAMVAILMNLVGVAVPVLAALFGERLGAQAYIGILTVLFGSVIACYSGKISFDRIGKILPPILMAVLSLSLSMIAEQEVYDNVDFFAGLVYFSLGLFAGGLSCYAIKSVREKCLYRVPGGATITFITSECTNIMAVVGSHYAIKISPSVSFVAVVESTVPVFVLLISIIMYVYCYFFGTNLYFLVALKKQFAGIVYKFIAIVLMAIGLYLIG